MKKILICTLILFSNLELFAQSLTDPKIEFKTLKTEHFEIIYDAKLKSVAHSYAHFSEYAYQSLKQLYSELPDKTVVLVDNSTDSANGFATFLPYPSIRAFPVLPNALDSISYYDNWGAELMLHEFTHILTFEPSHGFYTPLKYIFGTVVRPNGILPRWWQEGLAVEMESRFSKKGRLKSPATSALIRALVFDNKLEHESIDRVNETSIPDFPFGQRPYALGSLLWHELLTRTSPQFADQLLQRHSRRVPYLLNAPLEEKLNQPYQALLKSLYTDLQARSFQQKKQIETAGAEKLTPLLEDGFGQVNPAISPNGRFLAFVASAPFTGGSIQILERDPQKRESFIGKKPRTLIKGMGLIKISWLPDSTGFVYERQDVFEHYSTVRDLYFVNLTDGKEQRLTHGLRAQEPSFSPDGKWIVFVRNEGGHTELGLLNFSSKQQQILFRAPFQSRISRPEFLDNHRIIFSGHSHQARTEKLYVFNLETKKRFSVLNDFIQTGQAKRTTKGLLFTSQRTGINNLYLANGGLSSAQAITNTSTEVLNGEYDLLTDELITSRLTGEGRKLFSAKGINKYRPPKIEPVNKLSFTTEPSTFTEIPQLAIREEDYSPISYLLPRYWLPFIYPADGGMILQGATANSDPIGRHSYLLEGSYDSITEKISYGVNYLNRSTAVDLNPFYHEANEYLGASEIVLTNRITGLNSSFFLSTSEHWRGLLGGTYIETESKTSTLRRQGAHLGVDYVNFDKHEDKKFEQDIKTSVKYTHYFDQDDFISYDRYTGQFSHKISNPLPARHSLLTQLKVALSPELPRNLIVNLGDKTLGGNYFVSLIDSPFLLRGYPAAAFVGKQMFNLNCEYKLPLSKIYSGSGFLPIFFKDLEASVFVDGVAVDGGYFDPVQESYISSRIERNFWSTGLEFYLNTTFSYHLPLSFTLGLYYGFYEKAGGGFTPFLSIGYSGIDGIGSLF